MIFLEVREIFKNSDETALLLELEKILEKIKDKDLGALPQYPTIFWKKLSKTFSYFHMVKIKILRFRLYEPFRHSKLCHLPFQGRLINGNFIVKLKMPWFYHGILLKVLLDFFQKIVGCWGEAPRSLFLGFFYYFYYFVFFKCF